MKENIVCSGALFYATSTKRFLFLQRTDKKTQGMWGLVGGRSKFTESAFEGLKREIEEETGYRANKWQKLGEFPLAPGYSDEFIYAFLADDLEKLENPPAQDIDEDMETVLMTPQELEKAILEGEFIDAKSISSLFLAKPFLSRI